MPPVNSQGSRGGLIATLVVTIVLLMVSLIMWIYANSQWTKAETDVKTLHQKYDAIVSGGALSDGGAVADLNAAREKIASELQGTTAVDIAMAEIRRLTRTISKESTNFSDADQAAADAVKRAEAVLAKRPAGTQPSTAPAAGAAGRSLVAELDKLTIALSEQLKNNETQASAMALINTDLGTRVKGWDDQYAEIKKSFTSEHNRAQAATDKTTAMKKDYDEKVAKVAASANAIAAQAGAESQERLTRVRDLEGQLAAAAAKSKDLAERIQRQDVKNATVRAPDGAIVRVPATNVVYINLGSGDHLPVGITFEVYDKNEGIPALGNEPQSNAKLPVGKASIEVIRVGQNSSECRIIHMTPGATLSEGDLIANLVYDKNTTSNFVVYGRFDVDGNKIWTTEEGEVVKSLVTRWGGKVQDHLNAMTDFVVVGKEPEVPALTKDQKEDPILAKKYEDALKESKEYNDILSRATDLHVPVMNQNRFMYYIGYYDQLKR